MYPPGKETRLIVDDELVRIFRRHLEKLEAEGLETICHPLAIRLQFEFTARRSEICRSNGTGLIWKSAASRLAGTSKTGGISKPSEEAYRLLSTAPLRQELPVTVAPNDQPGI